MVQIHPVFKTFFMEMLEEIQRRIISNSHIVTEHVMMVQCNELVHRHTSQLLALL